MVDPAAIKAVRALLKDLPAPATILSLSNLSVLGPQQLLVLTTLTHAWCQDGVVRLIGLVETERPDWGTVLNEADDLLRKRLGTVQGFAELLEQTGDADAVGCLLILRRCLGALGQEITRRIARGPARKVSKEQETLDLEQARPGQSQRVPAQLRPLARALRIRKSFGSGIEDTAEDALGRALVVLAKKFPPWEGATAVTELVRASPFRQLRPGIASGWEDAVCADAQDRLEQARERLFLPYLMDWPRPLWIVHGNRVDTQRRGLAKKRGGAGTGRRLPIWCPECEVGTGVPPFQCPACGRDVPEDGSPGLRFEPLTAANEPPAGNLSPEFWRLEDRPQAAAFEKVVLEEIERRHGRKIREAIQALMNGEPKIEAAKQAHIDRKTLEDYLKKIRPWFNRRFR